MSNYLKHSRSAKPPWIVNSKRLRYNCWRLVGPFEFISMSRRKHDTLKYRAAIQEGVLMSNKTFAIPERPPGETNSRKLPMREPMPLKSRSLHICLQRLINASDRFSQVRTNFQRHFDAGLRQVGLQL